VVQCECRESETEGSSVENCRRLRLKCDGTSAETRFRLSTKRTSPFKLAGASVQSTTGSRAVHISVQGLYCSCKPLFYSYVTLTGYPLHSLISPSLLLPCVTVCHHISNAVYTGLSVSNAILCKEVGGSLKTDLLKFSYNYWMFENCLYTATTFSNLLTFAKYKGYFKIFKNFVINLNLKSSDVYCSNIVYFVVVL
jgi:hypothetical protein